jgi:hypothetical protein
MKLFQYAISQFAKIVLTAKFLLKQLDCNKKVTLLRKKLCLLSMVLSTLLCLYLVVSVDAASMWSRTYGGSICSDPSLIVTSDGGYAIAATTNASGAGSGDFWLVKTDALGNMQWNKTYGGTELDAAEAIVATSDGGYVIVGWTNSFGAGNDDFLLVKTDALGNMEWNRTYGETGDDRACSLVATSDGGYAIAGTTSSFGAGQFDFWLVKTDAVGNIQWNQTYGRTWYDYVYSLVATSNGGYALTGYTTAQDALGADVLLVKTDTLGNMQWNKTYGGSIAYSLIVTSDGGYAIGGTANDDFLLVKTDAFGNMQWNKTYGETGWDEVHSLVATSDGGYALAGALNYSIVSLSFPPTSFVYTGDFWLVKTDASGNMQWNQTCGGTGGVFAYSLVGTSDGGYALAGITGDWNLLLVKTNENGIVPEYSSWLIPALVLTATASILINKKRLPRKHS